jgi:hypothetical protein
VVRSVRVLTAGDPTPIVDLAPPLVRERLSGEGYKLRITVWDDDLLVGIIPFMLEHQWDFDKLLFVGTGLPDNPDLFARGGWKDRVLAAAIQVLRHCSMDQERRGQILYLAGQPIS